MHLLKSSNKRCTVYSKHFGQCIRTIFLKTKYFILFVYIYLLTPEREERGREGDRDSDIETETRGTERQRQSACKHEHTVM